MYFLPLRGSWILRVNWLTRMRLAAQYHAVVDAGKSDSRSFAAGLIAASLLAVGFVAYARWSAPVALPTQVELPILRVSSDASRRAQDSRTADRSSIIATVYECEKADQRVFSDRPCSEDARLREVSAPNGMRADRIAPPRPVTDRSLPDQTIPRAGSAEPVTSKNFICRSIDEQVDRINARMRQPYTAAEGEWYRERLRRLQDERWDAKCRIR